MAFEKLLDERNFEEVLRITDSACERDENAILARAQALMHLQRYHEANKVLTDGAIHARAGKATKYLQTCNAILAYAITFNEQATQVSKIPEDWYSRTLNEHVAAARNKKNRPQPQFLEGEVYILGTKDKLKKFGGAANTTDAVQRLRSAAPPYPLAQIDRSGYLYHKDETFLLPFSRKGWNKNNPGLVANFPLVKWECVGQVVQPHPECDVFVVHKALDDMTHQLLVRSLDDIAEKTKDYFVPMYQNIIDPNLSVVRSDASSPFRWKATEFSVNEHVVPVASVLVNIQRYVLHKCRRMLPRLAAELIAAHIGREDTQKVCVWGTMKLASPIPGVSLSDRPELYLAVDRVMTAAAPLMAKLRKPALLLPGRLQAVVKAQRIYLKPGEEYCGVWHVDGKHEAIVAVVLYYYRVSEGLEGGSLEFLSRRPRKEAFWLGGDCDYPETLTKDTVQSLLHELPRCKVPVQEGTMVVFSNYQLVHRVLRMTAVDSDPGAPDGNSSRDFLAFFVVDQRDPLPSTFHADIATGLALGAGIDAGSCGSQVEEVGRAVDSRRADRGSLKERIAADPEGPEAIRWSLFTDQMKPSGQFGLTEGLVYGTGNGSVALLGFFDNDLSKADLDDWGGVKVHDGFKWLYKMSESPPVHRGVSWVMDEPGTSWEEADEEKDE